MQNKLQKSNYPSFSRGNAVEAALDASFKGKTIEECRQIAINLYNEEIPDPDAVKNGTEFLAQLYKPEPEWTKENKRPKEWVTCDLVDKTIENFKESYPIPLKAQEGFEIFLNDWKFIGYLDYRFEDIRLITDLKTSAKTPTKNKSTGLHVLSPANKIQGTIYQLAFPRHSVEFVYVIPLKTGTKPVTIPFTQRDMEDVMPIMSRACQAMESFYEMFEGTPGPKRVQALKDLFMPDPSNMWSEADVEHSLKAFGIKNSDRLRVEPGGKFTGYDKEITFDQPKTSISNNPFLKK